MSRQRMQTCASCDQFPMKASTATSGRADCAIFNQPRDFADVACVLYNPAADLRQRKDLADQLRAKNTEREK